ncbi:aromatic acid/H+ symport family MFS transporter [Kribbella yunnanensis]|uniref:Aromatic acid/H+ symport family MFS transporter n=1 Tax=Kribbella yunnanensis TaxID=190194 RepID=A0ABP4UP76_9ACTN
MQVSASQEAYDGSETRSHPALIVLCMVITVIEGYNLIVYGNVVPLLLDDHSLGITDKQTGAIGGMAYLGAIVGAALAPVLAERLGRKRVLVTTITVFAAGALASGLAQDGQMLGGARLLVGLGMGGALTTAMTVARNSAASRSASLVVTITMAGIPLGGVIAALVSLVVLPHFGWRPMFFIGSAVALLITLAVARTQFPATIPQEVAGRSWTGRQKLRAVFTGRGAALAAVIALCAIANMVAWQGLNVWVTESSINLGFTLRTATLFAFTLTGAAVVASFASAWMADRRGSAVTAILTGSCTVLGMVLMLVLPTSTVSVLFCIALMGIGGHSTMNLIHTTTADAFPLPARAAALGWSNSTSFIGAFLGPTLGGIAIHVDGAYGVFRTFAIAATVCLVAVTALYALGRGVRRGGASTLRADASVEPVSA